MGSQKRMVLGMMIPYMAAAALLTACRPAGGGSSSEIHIVFADGTVLQAADLSERLNTPTGAGDQKHVTVTTAEYKEAVEAVQEGKADCGYAMVAGEDAVWYGMAKSEVMLEQCMALLSAKEITAVSELDKERIGYLDSLEELFQAFLTGSTGAELHRYRSEDQLLNDLDAGLLDAAAFSQDQAIEIWMKTPGLYISQPDGLPEAAYRFWGKQKEKVELAQSLWKEE